MISLRTVATMCVIFHLCSRSTGRHMVVSRALHRSAFAHPSIIANQFVSLPRQTMPTSFPTKARPLEDCASHYMIRRRLSSAIPSKRSADDYDDLFFVSATPKPPSSSQNYVPSIEDDEGDEQEVASDYDSNEKSTGNFFDDDYEYDREKFRAAQPNISPVRAKSTSSSSVQQPEPRSQQPYYPPKQPNYRATNNNSQQQQQRQQYSQQPQTGIPSTRALYQFRPIQPGSTRQMPPTSSSDYDSYDDYNTGEENNEMSFDHQNEGTTDEDLFAQADDTDYDPIEKGQVKRSAKIITKDASKVVDKQPPPVQSVAPQVTAKTEIEEEKQAPLDTPSNDSATSNNSQVYPRTPRNFTPAFMEPPRVKAIINNTDKADHSPRKIPVEASTGNVSTSYIDTLSHQLEHLQAQIYQLNDGVEFNIGSPKQVAKVLFGEDDEGSSTNKDVLEALASAGNVMAENIYKWRKVTSQIKKERKRIEQMEKGDRSNDYYGNLSRRDSRQSSRVDVQPIEEVTPGQVAIFETVPTTDDIPAPAAMDTVADRETLLLIDVSAYIFRSYHAMPPLHRSEDGMPTGALHGVCRMLQNLLLSQLLKGEQPRVILCFDARGDNFRHELYPEYKANRGPCPEDLIPQFDLVKEAATAFGLVQVEAGGYEADDVIATLSRLALDEGMNVDIMSGDKDLWQLVTAPDVFPRLHMIDPLHLDSISHDVVVEKWGVSSDKLGDLLALAGDAADNIKGAPGIGPKIAAQLINEFGSLSELLANTDKIKQKKRRESLDEHAENVMLFRQLVALEDAIPVERMISSPSFEGVSNVRMSSFDPSKLVEFYERMELRKCKSDLERRLRSSWINYKQPPTPADFSDVPF
mmetsp:Transcript_12859/g.25866  ORF Transcript_12859/g.25866 Transcript_12859/m.25866 type:complete len:862 (-) Transcript_12859:43-2628(-)